MAIGDRYVLRMQWRNGSSLLLAENSFAFEQVTAIVEPTVGEDLVGRFRTEVEPTFTQLVQTNYILERYTVAELPSKLLIYEEVITGVTGSVGGDPLPPQVAGVITLRTPTLGRRGRGRLYLPPTGESYNTGGQPSAGYKSGAIGVMDLIYAMSTANASYAEWLWGVWSTADQAFRIITSYSPRVLWGTQRGRTY